VWNASTSCARECVETHTALRGSHEDAAVLAVINLNLRRVVADVDIAVLTVLNNEHLPVDFSWRLDAHLCIPHFCQTGAGLQYTPQSMVEKDTWPSPVSFWSNSRAPKPPAGEICLPEVKLSPEYAARPQRFIGRSSKPILDMISW